HPKSKLISIAVYALPSDCVEEVNAYLEEGNNPDAPGYFFEWLTKKIDVYAFRFGGYWYDIGTLDGYIEAMTRVFNKSKIEQNAEIGGKIIHPVFVGKGAKIDNSSIIGPYAIIGSGSRISKSYISRSLVLENSNIAEAKIEESLIGSNVLIRGGEIKNSILAAYTKLRIS
ncbi:MAG: sugar phosphate nucleotidyltransferase, partial [Candidatus Njordarchaeota archaeon]